MTPGRAAARVAATSARGRRPILHAAYRRHVPFVDQDRVLPSDLACGAQIVRAWRRGQDAIEVARAPACSR